MQTLGQMTTSADRLHWHSAHHSLLVFPGASRELQGQGHSLGQLPVRQVHPLQPC